MQRRTFLIAAATGAAALVLTACTPSSPSPTPRPPLPSPSESGMPRPRAFMRSGWGADSFARGSSSYLPVGASPADREAMRAPVAGRVFFAGEATSSDRPNSVLGAWESGQRVAAEVLAAAAPGERVAVVGAGAAGASAALTLQQARLDVTVLEARSRVGGRIRTEKSDDWPVPVELGSLFIADTANAVRARVDSESLGDDPEDALTLAADGSPVRASLDAAASTVADALAKAADGLHDVSVASALRGAGVDAASGDGDVGLYLAGSVVGRLGAETSALSAWYALDELPSGGERLVTGGYAGVVTDVLGGVQVSLSTAVTGVSHSADGVSLRLGTGESLGVDRVVVTVPLGVLQKGGIEFDPPLPMEQRAAIAALGVGVQDAVWLLFDDPFWSTEAARWSVRGADLPIVEWINLAPATGSPVLVGLLAGDAATAFAKLDDAAALAAAVESLRPFRDAGA